MNGNAIFLSPWSQPGNSWAVSAIIMALKILIKGADR